MERIKEALERAREERQRLGGSAGDPARTGGTAPGQRIEYTQTRREPVSEGFLREQRIVTAVSRGGYVESFRILRTQVLQRLQENHWNVLAVTSPGDNEGKTLTAINLAIILAKEASHTVLLVDADLRHPNVHTYFGVKSPRGLSEYLTGDLQLPELLFNPGGIDGLVVLPGGGALANSSEVLSSSKMVRLVEEMKTRYASRIVIFDLPPLLAAADVLAFAPYMDAVLVVAEAGKTQTDDLNYAQELLARTNIIGTVLNKSRYQPEEHHRTEKVMEKAERVQAGLRQFANRFRRRKKS